MRVLVTGASGFLGQHLTAALWRRGDYALALVRDMVVPPNIASGTIHGGYEQVERAIAEREIDAVVHLAAQTQVSTAVADPTGTWESNVAGTWRVLEACRRQRVRRVIVASSDKVYGERVEPYREVHRLKAGGVYATSKVCADMIAQAYFEEYGMNISITRCGNLYGPGHTNWSTLIPGVTRSFLRGEQPRLRSSGRTKRDFLHVSDAVAGYLKLLDGDSSGHIYNFGTGVGSTPLEVVELIRQAVGSDLEPVFTYEEGLEIQEQVLDASLAKTELGWEPRHTLATGLDDTIKWYRCYMGVV